VLHFLWSKWVTVVVPAVDEPPMPHPAERPERVLDAHRVGDLGGDVF
jgi:hypothetical protein